jgi:uncharacterized protein YhfF
VDFADQPRFELGVPGKLRDRLVAAVLAGEKVATTSLLGQFEHADEALPRAGQRYVLVDSAETAVGIVEVLEVRVLRLGDADLQLAIDEGEGFASINAWRTAHDAYWVEHVLPALPDPDRVDDDTMIVVERFRLLGDEPDD